MKTRRAISMQTAILVAGCASAAPSTTAEEGPLAVAHETPGEPRAEAPASPITDVTFREGAVEEGLTLTSVASGAALSSETEAIVVPTHGCAAAAGHAWAVGEVTSGPPASARLRRLQLEHTTLDASDLAPHELGVGVSARALDRDVLVRLVEPLPDGSLRVGLRVSGGDSPEDLEPRMSGDREVRIAITRVSYASLTLASSHDALGCPRLQIRFVDRTADIATPADGVETVLLEGMGIRRGASTLHFLGLTVRRARTDTRPPLVVFQEPDDDAEIVCVQGTPCVHGELSIDIVDTDVAGSASSVTVRLAEHP